MKKTLLSLLAGIFAISLATSPVSASEPEKTDTVFTPGKMGTVSIGYTDGEDGEDPVMDAEFTLYKVADFTGLTDNGTAVGTGYRSIVPGITFTEDNTAKVKDENGKILTVDSDPNLMRNTVMKAYHDDAFLKTKGRMYKGKTDSIGWAQIENVEPAAYLMLETKPAAKHYKSVPALINVPEMTEDGWNYHITITPKSIPGGDLTIKKTVKGDNVETKRDFHFKVVIESADGNGTVNSSRPKSVNRKVYLDPANIDYVYTTSDGRNGTVMSGEQVSLKPGTSLTIEKIPVGARYKVTEVEANQDGYTTKASCSAGNIRKNGNPTAEFINERYKPKNTRTTTYRPGRPSGGGGGTTRTSTPISRILTAVKTGDTTRMLLFAALSLAAVLVLILTRKRRNKATGKDGES